MLLGCGRNPVHLEETHTKRTIGTRLDYCNIVIYKPLVYKSGYGSSDYQCALTNWQRFNKNTVVTYRVSTKIIKIIGINCIWGLPLLIS